MEKNKDIEQEIEKTLSSLSGIAPAEPRPFFYTRLKARMEQKYAPQLRWTPKPAWIVGALIVVLSLNLWGALRYNSRHSHQSNTQTEQQFADEYGLKF